MNKPRTRLREAEFSLDQVAGDIRRKLERMDRANEELSEDSGVFDIGELSKGSARDHSRR